MIACRVAMANSTKTEFIVLEDAETLARCVADWLLNRVTAVKHSPAVCLAGGSTPRLLYQLLAMPPYRDRFPWQHIHWFWSDERFVARADSRSNYGMAKAALFDHVPVPPENIHPIPTEGSPQQAAAEYERILQQYYGATQLAVERPLFAATLLGVGEDGHTASLFPGNPILEERKHWVAAVSGAKQVPRITLTFPTLGSCGEAAFLVSGAGKSAILARIRGGEDMPAARIESAGRVRWFVDRAAAGTTAP